MKGCRFGLVLVVISLILFSGAFFLAQAQEDIQKQTSCKYCGMDRAKFAQSRMFIEYEDGTIVGTCSIHCVAIDLSLNIDKTPKAIGVGITIQRPSSTRKRRFGLSAEANRA